MTLRNKTLIITAITLAGFSLVFFWFSRMVLHTGFSEIETEDARRNTTRAVNALEREFTVLDTKVKDWASWDDTYAFIVDKNDAYIKANLVLDSYVTLNINFIVFVNSAGETVYAGGCDLVDNKAISLPASIERLLVREEKITRHTKIDSTVDGILMAPEGPLVIASRPIVTSVGSGPIRGTLIFARYLDDSEIKSLSEITQFDITIKKWNDSSLPSDYREAAFSLSQETPIIIRSLSDKIIGGYAYINDVFGNPALIMNITMPRDILAYEKHSMTLMGIVLLAVSIAFIGCILFFLEKSILSRLTRLGREFGNIGLRGDFSMRIANAGKDELDGVALSGNRMLEALEEAHNHISNRNREMRTIMDTVPIALLSLDGEYKVGGEYSKYAETLFSCAHLVDKSYFELLELKNHNDYDLLIGFFNLLLKNTVSPEQLVKRNPFPELQISGKNEHEAHWINIEYNLITDKKENSKRILVIIEDVTERKHAEEGRKKLQSQLLQAQKMESIGRLAGGVAHDFNNMLGVIIGNAELAMMQIEPGSPIYDELVEIQKAATRSANLTRQLLAFARKQPSMPKVLNLNETIDGMLKMLLRLIGEDIDLIWLPGENLFHIKIDPVQIDQILANLCINARDAISGVGKITIETRNIVIDESYDASNSSVSKGSFVQMVVSDDGCGMDKETQSRLFEPFFTTKSVDKGTGLGLATVYGVVKQNNGFINVYSEPGHGTSFKIYFPEFAGEIEHVQEKHLPDLLIHGHETILVAEDEPANLKLSKRILEDLGYRVLAANSPVEALRLAREYTDDIHLLITDVIMPNMNGRDLAQSVVGIYPETKCLFMSGYTANVIAHHGVLADGVSFIQKPFSVQDFAVKVRCTLDAE
jgi:signal transduction histidine kinase/sensor domain CHASE-containing protein